MFHSSATLPASFDERHDAIQTKALISETGHKLDASFGGGSRLVGPRQRPFKKGQMKLNSELPACLPNDEQPVLLETDVRAWVFHLNQTAESPSISTKSNKKATLHMKV